MPSVYEQTHFNEDHLSPKLIADSNDITSGVGKFPPNPYDQQYSIHQNANAILILSTCFPASKKLTVLMQKQVFLETEEKCQFMA